VEVSQTKDAPWVGDVCVRPLDAVCYGMFNLTVTLAGVHSSAGLAMQCN